METLKDLAIDAFVLFATWFIVTAGGFSAKKFSCGAAQQTSIVEKVP